MTHQKTLAAPKPLRVHRKEAIWMPSARSGPHGKAESIPLLTLMRDYLDLADNRKEIKYILQNKGVLVDGKRVRDDRYPVGLFDIVSIPETGVHLIILVSPRGKLYSEKIDAKDASKKLCKIVGKTQIKGGKLQLNLYDGKNILVDGKDSKKYKTGDTLVLKLPELSIEGHIPFEKGKVCFIMRGRHTCMVGALLEFTQAALNIRGLSTIETKEGKITTSTEYVFVVGDKEPLLKILSK